MFWWRDRDDLVGDHSGWFVELIWRWEGGLMVRPFDLGRYG